MSNIFHTHTNKQTHTHNTHTHTHTHIHTHKDTQWEWWTRGDFLINSINEGRGQIIRKKWVGRKGWYMVYGGRGREVAGCWLLGNFSGGVIFPFFLSSGAFKSQFLVCKIYTGHISKLMTLPFFLICQWVCQCKFQFLTLPGSWK